MRMMLAAALAAMPALAQPAMPSEAPGKPDPRIVTKGRYSIDPTDLAASRIEVVFPIAGVRTTVAALDTVMQGPELLDAAKFPTARFVSTKVVARGLAATITGDLTLHGVTRPVVLQASFIGAGPEFWGDRKMALGFETSSPAR